MAAARQDAEARALRIAAGVRLSVANRRLAAGGERMAAEMIGPIRKGDHITGLTNGQFSLLDILDHILTCIGPADVAISTWTMGVYDHDHAAKLFADKRILRIRWLVDPVMFKRRPQLAGAMVKAFGAESFRTCKSHAKFMTLVNDGFAVCVRSSMNLNLNERLENFDISEDAPLCAFFNGVVDQAFSALPLGTNLVSGGDAFFADLLSAFEREQARESAALADRGLDGLRSIADLAAGLQCMST